MKEEVRLPVANVTKVALGGEDLRTAYVTTARVGLSSDGLATQPEAGGLFAFAASTPGRALPRARAAALRRAPLLPGASRSRARDDRSVT